MDCYMIPWANNLIRVIYFGAIKKGNNYSGKTFDSRELETAHIDIRNKEQRTQLKDCTSLNISRHSTFMQEIRFEYGLEYLKYLSINIHYNKMFANMINIDNAPNIFDTHKDILKKTNQYLMRTIADDIIKRKDK